jgi:hypothetical protein
MSARSAAASSDPSSVRFADAFERYLPPADTMACFEGRKV